MGMVNFEEARARTATAELHWQRFQWRLTSVVLVVDSRLIAAGCGAVKGQCGSTG